MNHFLKAVLSFIPFTIVFYILCIFIWGDFAPQFLKKNLNYCRPGMFGYTLTRLTEAKEIKDIDILFLGSSHAYRGFDTRLFKNFGFNTFNMGTSAQTPMQTEVLLKKYLNSLNPRIIIFEVNLGMFSNDGVESAIDIISNDRIDQYVIDMAIKQKNIKVFNSLIYAIYRSKIYEQPAFDIYYRYGDDTYVPGGYVQKDLSFYKFVDYGNRTNNLDIKPIQLQSFKNIIELIKNKNIRLILVQSPITKSLYKTYINQNQFQNLMKSHGEYYNFNELVSLNDSLDFFDNLHLNQSGVEVFNKKLIDVLFYNENIK